MNVDGGEEATLHSAHKRKVCSIIPYMMAAAIAGHSYFSAAGEEEGEGSNTAILLCLAGFVGE